MTYSPLDFIIPEEAEELFVNENIVHAWNEHGEFMGAYKVKNNTLLRFAQVAQQWCVCNHDLTGLELQIIVKNEGE